MDDESAGIDTQTYRVADQRERHERQQHGQHQQYQTDAAQVHIDLVHQVFHVGQVTYAAVLPEFFGYPLQRVTVGIVGGQLYFQRSREWIEP